MIAMILAAGFGNRMRPLSERLPKPLLPILGRPLITYTIEHLKTVSVDAIGVNVHHLAEKVASSLGNGAPWGIEIVLSREKKILGTGGGMRTIRELFPGEDLFLVYNGDILSDINLPGLIKQHLRRGALVTMALRDCPPKNNVTLRRDGTIVDFLGKLGTCQPGKDQNLTFTGISVVDASVLDRVPCEGASNIIDIYLELINCKPGSIQGYVARGNYWVDIGTPVSYLQVHRDILVDGKLVSFSGERHGSGIYTGAGSVIESGARLEGFVCIGRSCLIKRKTFLKNCVIWDGTVVEEGDYLEDGVKDGEWHYSILG
ncbi:MAG: NDP-sugar synthase [Pseudomonadota bacterium]